LTMAQQHKGSHAGQPSWLPEEGDSGRRSHEGERDGTADARHHRDFAGTRARRAGLVTTVSMVSQRVPRRIATLSVHTSPLDHPGTPATRALTLSVFALAQR